MIWKRPEVTDITPTDFSKVGNLKHIERCGRTCYDSLDKMTDDSYERFYNVIVPANRKDPSLRYCDFHLSVLEHATIYLHINSREERDMWLIDFFIHNKYSRVNIDAPFGGGLHRVVHDYDMEGPWFNVDYFIATNWRVLYENDDLMMKKMNLVGDYGCDVCHTNEEPSIFDYIEQYRVTTPDNRYPIRKTFVVHTGIDITREFNRHRCLSVSESSTRYIDPTLPNHGGNIPYNDFETDNYTWLFMDAFKDAERRYRELRSVGFKPQIARKVLPTGTASTVVYTGFIDDWRTVMWLRSKKAGAKGVHPDAVVIADMIYDALEGFLTEPVDGILYKANFPV